MWLALGLTDLQVRRPINFTSPSLAGSSKKGAAHQDKAAHPEKASVPCLERPKVPPFAPSHAAVEQTPLLSALSTQPPWPPRPPLPAPRDEVRGLDVDCESVLRWLLEGAFVSPAAPFSRGVSVLAPSPHSIFLPLPPTAPAQPLPDAPRERSPTPPLPY